MRGRDKQASDVFGDSWPCNVNALRTQHRSNTNIAQNWTLRLLVNDRANFLKNRVLRRSGSTSGIFGRRHEVQTGKGLQWDPLLDQADPIVE